MSGEAGHVPTLHVARSVFHVLALSARTPAPAAATATTSPLVVARASLASRWRADKRIVDIDNLLEQLCSVGALDGSFRIVECGVFDEAVALLRR
jgi:hypothetical protein